MAYRLVGSLLAAAVSAGAQTPMLSTAAFAKASALIDSTGRPLERALRAYHFAHGSRDAVIAALATFQNADGGFATNLESDARWDGSSPMATMVAFKVFNDVAAPASDPHVQRAIRYLVATFDGTRGYWHALPRGVNTAPHAPWWEVHDSTGTCDVESPVFPTAALAGYLRPYQGLLPSGFVDRITASSLAFLASAPVEMKASDIEMLTELVRLLPHDGRADSAARKLRAVLGATVERDPKKWTSYTIQPLNFIPGPGSPFYPGLEKAVEANLDYVIARQEADGGWALTWSWEKVDPAAWAIAKREWRGAVALEDLERLEAFKRISN